MYVYHIHTKKSDQNVTDNAIGPIIGISTFLKDFNRVDRKRLWRGDVVK